MKINKRVKIARSTISVMNFVLCSSNIIIKMKNIIYNTIKNTGIGKKENDWNKSIRCKDKYYTEGRCKKDEMVWTCDKDGKQ